ncbi:MAG: ABC transporter substrate-binding protein [Deltaproteobacteria bacterium]|nr:ABC transporter substrate-binding protein [Deltaproteobacteria bacterium]
MADQRKRTKLLRALGLPAAALTILSCSFIVDKNATQCSGNSDCDRFPGTLCVNQACVVPPCSTNQECVAQYGQYYICRKPDYRCAKLLSDDCTTVEGNYLDDAAIVIGSVLPTTGPDSSMGIAMENSVKLAIGDFSSAANGLPPRPGSTARRPIVLVGCSDNSSADTGVRAATHLVNDVGVPAIIGAAFSGISIKVATNVTIPAGVLLISPSATSVAITDLQDNGLVWRTAPSDAFQASALALLVPMIEQQIRVDLMLKSTDAIKLAIVHKGDAYGKGLGSALEKLLQFNGKPAVDNAGNYLRFDYGDPGDGDCLNCPAAVTKVLDFKPHILLDFGTNEAVTQVFKFVESTWDAQTPYRPRYLFSDGGEIQELSALIDANNELRSRIRGTVPGTNNLLYKSFRNQYLSAFPSAPGPDVFGTAGSYDSLYLIGYSVVSLGATLPTGPNLAAGLRKMVPPGTQIDVGADKINNAFAVLTAGQNIDYNGASGPLNFDINTGEAPSDIQIWCVPKDANGKATAAQNSGLFFNAATGSLEGAIGTQCN